MEESTSHAQGKAQGKGVIQLVSQRQRLPAPLQGLIRIAEEPQRPGRPRQRGYAKVLRQGKRQGRVLLRIVEGDDVLKVL